MPFLLRLRLRLLLLVIEAGGGHGLTVAAAVFPQAREGGEEVGRAEPGRPGP
uniref:Uncharacterized protein n=1 Tax=Arundo donax TaxID=35708 RepID=A0A0A8XNF0_ARUDO